MEKINLRKRAVPLCKECGEQHYNFQACPERQDQKPEGWSNKFGNTWEYLGGNSVIERQGWK